MATDILAQRNMGLTNPNAVVIARAVNNIFTHMNITFGIVLIAATPIARWMPCGEFLFSARLTPQVFHTRYWSNNSPDLEQKSGLYSLPIFLPLQYPCK
jgi:hypothetical protein